MTPRAGLLLLALAPCASAADITSGEMRASFRLWDEGVHAVLKDDRAAARDKWQRCLKVDPDNKDCRAGLKLLGTSKPAGARSVPSAAAPPTADRDERGAQAAWHRGVIAFQKMDYNTAREAWEKCLRLDPRNVDCGIGLDRIAGRATAPAEDGVKTALKHWNAGIIFFQNGDYQRAREEWLLCRRLDVDNQDCRTGLRRLDSTDDP